MSSSRPRRNANTIRPTYYGLDGSEDPGSDSGGKGRDSGKRAVRADRQARADHSADGAPASPAIRETWATRSTRLSRKRYPTDRLVDKLLEEEVRKVDKVEDVEEVRAVEGRPTTRRSSRRKGEAAVESDACYIADLRTATKEPKGDTRDTGIVLQPKLTPEASPVASPSEGVSGSAPEDAILHDVSADTENSDSEDERMRTRRRRSARASKVVAHEDPEKDEYFPEEGEADDDDDDDEPDPGDERDDDFTPVSPPGSRSRAVRASKRASLRKQRERSSHEGSGASGGATPKRRLRDRTQLGGRATEAGTPPLEEKRVRARTKFLSAGKGNARTRTRARARVAQDGAPSPSPARPKRRSAVDSDDDMADDSSDSSDDELEMAGSGGGGGFVDFSMNPMALMDELPRADGRAPRPSRYAKRRSRAANQFDRGAQPQPHVGKQAQAKPAGIEPIQVDLSLSWDDIGGLDHHVRALKEMVFLPLMYPEVFDKFKMAPPKGVLFYGPPGTGKTLCARALAASCGGVDEPEAAATSADKTSVPPASAPLDSSPAPGATATPVDPSNAEHALGQKSGATPPAVKQVTQPPQDTPAVVLSPKGNQTSNVIRIRLPQTQKNTQPLSGGSLFEAEKNGDATTREKRSASRSPHDHSPNSQPQPDLMRDINHTPPKSNGVVHVGTDEPSPVTAEPGVPGQASAVVGTDNKTPSPGTRAADPGASGATVPGPDRLVPSVPAKPKRRPRVAFFMRNGADCLSKWVGEAERQLRMTFEAAKKHQPSIIFFDEIDGLAPVRSARQDQIHSSIVSTLLGLMDGLDARGQIVVIGATNRVDAIDPALRRPGRFDRELIFTLPNCVARRKIMDIHTSKWLPKPDNGLLDTVASKTVGYCGADLRALCSEAAIRSLRRRYPQIYDSREKLLIDIDQVQVRTRDFVSAMKDVVPASHRSARTYARPLNPRLLPLLGDQLKRSTDIVKRVFPQGVSPSVQTGRPKSPSEDANIASAPNVEEDDDDLSGWSSDDSDSDVRNGNSQIEVDVTLAGKDRAVPGRGRMDRPITRARLLVCGYEGSGQTQMGPALLHFLEGCPVHSIDLPSLLADVSARSSEEALVSAVREACRAVPSVLYLPHLGSWWSVASEHLQTTLTIVLRDIPADLPLFLLATAEQPLDKLPEAVSELFGEFVRCGVPTFKDRKAMFAPLLKEIDMCPKVTNAVLKRRKRARLAEVLPKAPPPSPKVATPEEVELRDLDDDRYIRALRMQMRDFVERLRTDRRFIDFRDPVDPKLVPDYHEHIKHPMWIGKISEQVDKGMYPTVFSMVQDFDTLVSNAVQYNPPMEASGAAILRRAHALVDVVHTWVDKLNPELVERCNSIVASRLDRLDRMAQVAADAAAATKKAEAAAAKQSPEVALPPDSKAAEDDAQVSKVTQADAMVVDLVEAEGSVPELHKITRSACNGNDTQAPPEPVNKESPNVAAVTIPLPSGSFGYSKSTGKQGAHASAPDATKSNKRPRVEDEDPDEHVELEEPFIRASSAELQDLSNSWIEVTTGMNVDSVDMLFVRCSTVLYDARRSRDRRLAAKGVASILVAARCDPGLKLVQ